MPAISDPRPQLCSAGRGRSSPGRMRARAARAQLRSLPAERCWIRPNQPPRYNCRHAYDNTIPSGDAAPGTTDRGQTDATLHRRDSDRSVRRKRPQTHPARPRVVVVPCRTPRSHTCVRLRSSQRRPTAPCAGVPDRRLGTGAGKTGCSARCPTAENASSRWEPAPNSRCRCRLATSCRCLAWRAAWRGRPPASPRSSPFALRATRTCRSAPPLPSAALLLHPC
jgi:hypothetical protein